jgi:hypothetical protein
MKPRPSARTGEWPALRFVRVVGHHWRSSGVGRVFFR